MPQSKWEASLQVLTLGLCFGIPLFIEISPDYLPLTLMFVLALWLWVSLARSSDPFLSAGRVNAVAPLLYANVVSYSLSGVPATPLLTPSAAVVLVAYVLVLIFAIVRACRRVADIDLEYFRYSLPSRRLTVDVGRRTGRLDQAQAAMRLQLFVKEGLQFRRLSRVCRLLAIQTWGGLLMFLIFGFREPWHLLVFLATSLVVSASATSIASKATLHEGGDEGDFAPSAEDGDENSGGGAEAQPGETAEPEEDEEEYIPRRRRRLRRG